MARRSRSDEARRLARRCQSGPSLRTEKRAGCPRSRPSKEANRSGLEGVGPGPEELVQVAADGTIGEEVDEGLRRPGRVLQAAARTEIPVLGHVVDDRVEPGVGIGAAEPQAGGSAAVSG